MDNKLFFFFFGSGLLLVGGLAFAWLIFKLLNLNQQYKTLLLSFDEVNEHFHEQQSQNQQLSAQITYWTQQIESKNKQLDNLKDQSFQEKIQYEQKISALNQQLAQRDHEKQTIEIQWQEFKSNTQEKIQFLQDSEARLAHQFESLSSRIMATSQNSLSEQNQNNLISLLSPLKAQIDQFNQQLNERLTHESRERFALKFEISQLQTLNQRLATEALNLTNALKGNNKIQGNWGEMILMNLLSSVGFTEGREYSVQTHFMNEEQKSSIPDVIIHLPEDKHVIVDAKVSLIAYEKYFHSSSKEEANEAIKGLLASIQAHMKGLSEKHYPSLAGLNTLEYVLMFIPIEAAFMLAMSESENLLAQAQKRNIMLVSPSTLLVALRTIAQLWRSEYKNQNANAIALKASRLYDKFRLFLEDLHLVGQHIHRTEQSYQSALSKLTTGKGNILQQVESFKALGVDVKKEIADKYFPESFDSSITEEEDSFDESLSSSFSGNNEDFLTKTNSH